MFYKSLLILPIDKVFDEEISMLNNIFEKYELWPLPIIVKTEILYSFWGKGPKEKDIFLGNEKSIYFFKNSETLFQFLKTPTSSNFSKHPSFSTISKKLRKEEFEEYINDEETKIFNYDECYQLLKSSFWDKWNCEEVETVLNCLNCMFDALHTIKDIKLLKHFYDDFSLRKFLEMLTFYNPENSTDKKEFRNALTFFDENKICSVYLEIFGKLFFSTVLFEAS